MHVKYKGFQSTRRFGVELEVSSTKPKAEIGKILSRLENAYCYGNGGNRKVVVTSGIKGWSETNNNDYWHVKYDSTCGPLGKGADYGWEVASYIGDADKDIERISIISDWLGIHLNTNNNCGLHIHVEVKDFSKHDMGVLLANWLKVEYWLRVSCPKHRDNEHCIPLRTRKVRRVIGYNHNNPKSFYDDMQPTSFSSHNNPDKKYALNIMGYTIGTINTYYDRKTVELRLPECILEKQHIESWVLLITNFIESSKSSLPPKSTNSAQSVPECLEILGLGGEDVILDNKLLAVKRWFLQRIIDQERSMLCAEEAKEHLAFISRF